MTLPDTFLPPPPTGRSAANYPGVYPFGQHWFWYAAVTLTVAFDLLLGDTIGLRVTSGLLVALVLRSPALGGSVFATAFIVGALVRLPTVGLALAPVQAGLDVAIAGAAVAVARLLPRPSGRVRSARALIDALVPGLAVPAIAAGLAGLLAATPLAPLFDLAWLAAWPEILLGTAVVMPIILVAGGEQKVAPMPLLAAMVAAGVVVPLAERLFPFPFIIAAVPLYIAATRLPPVAIATLAAAAMLEMAVISPSVLEVRAAGSPGAIEIAAALTGLLPTGLALLLAELRAERQRLAATGERLRRLLEGLAGHGFCTLSRAGTIVGWNDSIAALTVRPAVDVVGLAYDIVFAVDDRDTHLPATLLARAIETGRAEHGGWCLRGDGDRFWAHMTVEANHDSRGDVSGFIVTIRDDSELQRSQDALLAAEQRWGFALGSAGHGVWEHDLAAGRMHYSAAYAAMLGLDEDVLGDDPAAWRARVHPDDVARLPDDRADDPAGAEFRLRHADGRWLWIADRRRVAERDKAGRPLRVIGSQLDVTARKQAEIERELSEARYRMMAEHMIDIVAHLDLDLNRLWISPACRDILGYEPYALTGTTPAMIAHPDDLPEIERSLRLVAAGTERLTFLARYRHADGGWVWLNVTLRLLRGPSGSPVGILSVARDVTRARAAEEALKASEATFRGAMESASIGMVLEELDGRWTSVNRAFSVILGREEDDLIGQHAEAYTAPDDVGIDQKLRRQLLAGEIATYEVEKRCVHASGRFVWTLQNVSLDRAADGTPRRLIVQIQDITERRRVEQMKSEFISMVSHELRTPLTSIRGALGLVLGAMAPDLPPRAVQLVDIAHKNSERLIPLINDILDLDKIESGQLRVDLVDTDAVRLTAQAVDAMRDVTDRYGVTVRLRRPDAPTPIRVDEGRFLQIVTNLLSNAAKFSPRGAEIDVEVTVTPRRVCVAVCDRGPGIAEEFRSRIFGRFAQADSATTRAKGGSGLGLHICRRLAGLMGGSVDFDSTIGVGSVFWVEFPLAETGAAEASAATTGDPAAWAVDPRVSDECVRSLAAVAAKAAWQSPEETRHVG